MKDGLFIVLDFGGTVVTRGHYHIGKDIGAIPVLKELVESGHKLILFTMRYGDLLDEAVEWFKKNDIVLFGIQRNPLQISPSPKAHGDIIIDDKSIGIPLKFDPELSYKPFVDWIKVRELLVEKNILK